MPGPTDSFPHVVLQTLHSRAGGKKNTFLLFVLLHPKTLAEVVPDPEGLRPGSYLVPRAMKPVLSKKQCLMPAMPGA